MGEPWTTTYRLARQHGVTEWELRKAFDHPYRGMVRPGGIDPGDPDVRIGDALSIMTTDDVITGWAAARGHGVAHADGRDHRFRTQPVSIISTGGGQHRPQPGLAESRRTIHEHEICRIGEVRTATLVRAAYDMALDAPDLASAVAAIDMCVSTCVRQGRTTITNIAALMAQHVKTRGIVQARRALVLASTRSASPWESRTRCVAEVRGGLRGLQVNVPIFDRAGRLAGVADLLDHAAGFVIESDGAGHRTEARHAKDNIREEGLEVLGLFVVRVSAMDHRDERELASRLQRGRLHAAMRRVKPLWTTDQPAWWSGWEPGRRWD
ncbi:hypothetical protein [Aeromicrobium sp.]|uniref:hypothetical protein n=1 Tax=Aeromicrobium sp. TaxID=1871063 RepID=UPI0019A69845|nr:hypothetical protein [Aeromicrobium sp.]MBC7631642.1 hypothetical protein [Aeromicrobium sp.]